MGLALLCGALAPAAAPGVACAAEGSYAALVVDTGDTVYNFCVQFPGGSVTGLQLIDLAHDQYGLDYYATGGFVCMLAGVGPTGNDCVEESQPDFWGYWHGNGSGGWNWSSVGAGDYRVENGDVEGWSYGSGMGGAAHPQPPATTYEMVCGDAGTDPSPGTGGGDDGDKPDSPEPDRTPRSGGEDHEETGDGGRGPQRDRPSGRDGSEEKEAAGNFDRENSDDAPPADDKSDKGDDSKGRERASGRNNKQPTPTPAPTPTPSPSPSDRVVAGDDYRPLSGGSSPSVVGMVGLGLTLMLAGAGVLIARRRQRLRA